MAFPHLVALCRAIPRQVIPRLAIRRSASHRLTSRRPSFHSFKNCSDLPTSCLRAAREQAPRRRTFRAVSTHREQASRRLEHNTAARWARHRSARWARYHSARWARYRSAHRHMLCRMLRPLRAPEPACLWDFRAEARPSPPTRRRLRITFSRKRDARKTFRAALEHITASTHAIIPERQSALAPPRAPIRNSFPSRSELSFNRG